VMKLLQLLIKLKRKKKNRRKIDFYVKIKPGGYPLGFILCCIIIILKKGLLAYLYSFCS
jgi:hypothetical protein